MISPKILIHLSACFADDCLLYRIIESTEDTKLHQDVNILSEWANTPQLNFNVNKCAVNMMYQNHSSNHKKNSTLNSQIIEVVEQYSYLGIMQGRF